MCNIFYELSLEKLVGIGIRECQREDDTIDLDTTLYI